VKIGKARFHCGHGQMSARTLRHVMIRDASTPRGQEDPGLVGYAAVENRDLGVRPHLAIVGHQKRDGSA
jgi:hypothetical protein